MTGALILVALFVIVASEMFSGTDARRKDNAVVVDSGPPLRSYTMDLGDASADQSALAPNPASSAASPVAEAPAPEAVDQLPVETVSVEPAPAAVAPAEARPLPQPESAPSATTPAPAGAWWVQVGSFSQSANAERVVRELGATGIPAKVSSVRSKGKELFRVRAGPVADRQAADALRQRLAGAGHKGSVVPP